MTTAPAGWYPNPENNLEVRYWDGTQWTHYTEVSAAATVPLESVGDAGVRESAEAPRAAESQDPQLQHHPKRTRRTPVWVVAATGVAALLLGMGVGAVASGDAAHQIALADLEQQLAISQEETTSAEQAHDDAVASHAERAAALTEERDKLTDERDSLSDERDALADEIDTLTDSVSELTQKISDEQAKTAAEKQRADAAEERVAASEPSSDSPQSSASTYYQNCTAARAAGAAPVYSGDPGYGPHLDRDGDGVGCE